MKERKVICSKCKKTTTVFLDNTLPGWIFKEPGWALVNNSHFCPQCNEDRLKSEVMPSASG
jgi:hypothetical protein